MVFFCNSTHYCHIIDLTYLHNFYLSNDWKYLSRCGVGYLQNLPDCKGTLLTYNRRSFPFTHNGIDPHTLFYQGPVCHLFLPWFFHYVTFFYQTLTILWKPPTIRKITSSDSKVSSYTIPCSKFSVSSALCSSRLCSVTSWELIASSRYQLFFGSSTYLRGISVSPVYKTKASYIYFFNTIIFYSSKCISLYSRVRWLAVELYIISPSTLRIL